MARTRQGPKARLEKQLGLIEEAKMRIRLVMEEHHGFFWSTSELARCLGMESTIIRVAIGQILQTVENADGWLQKVPDQRGSAYELTYQQPSPDQKHSLYLAHWHSMTENEHGSDCHPWRNRTLACPICAGIRAVNPDWHIVAESAEDSQHMARHEVVPHSRQIALGRRKKQLTTLESK